MTIATKAKLIEALQANPDARVILTPGGRRGLPFSAVLKAPGEADVSVKSRAMTHALVHDSQPLAAESESSDGQTVYRLATPSDDYATTAELKIARQMYCEGSDDTIEIDVPALASRGEEGVWVQAWVLVPADLLPGYEPKDDAG